jgi:uncharacterized damage-inducible protein DinB
MFVHHRRMFAFDHWANTVSLDAVEPVAEQVPASMAWLNHILGAKCIWLARVTATPAPFGVNPTFGAAGLRDQFAQVHHGWMQFLAQLAEPDVVRVVHYTNLKGDPFSSPLGDILSHLPIHGQHHRGQVNADLRAAGVAPPAIDFIHASRIGVIG